jgi:hypothetical protein
VDNPVRYQDVVENIERNAKRILDFCGLAFDRACVPLPEEKLISETRPTNLL